VKFLLDSIVKIFRLYGLWSSMDLCFTFVYERTKLDGQDGEVTDERSNEWTFGHAVSHSQIGA